jgi:hypothetical protein
MNGIYSSVTDTGLTVITVLRASISLEHRALTDSLSRTVLQITKSHLTHDWTDLVCLTLQIGMLYGFCPYNISTASIVCVAMNV